MRRSLWVLCVALGFSACKKEKAEPAPAAPQAARPSPAPSPDEQADEDEASEAELAPGPYPLTKEKLDAYVGYQRKLLEAYETLLKDLAQTKRDAGKGDDLAEVNATMKLIEGKARAEEAARKEAGLSEVDVNGIADIVTAVISQRQLTQSFHIDEELKKLEEMQAKLRPEQREELAPQLAAMRERTEELQKLTEVRRTYGDANVDLVLTREEDLAKNYQDMLNTFSKR
ncbi:hypothetical protein [Hyalangium minutum]|uniref:Putative lipoprotein n=1 Tax=Hyalangium minutum TaxID=394096 RepID=A0A085WXJ5_9BACT|nr:hypothetical protein [Hyalangium minutum]KFE72408.1 putative lipoprotein [Hyalangium minutum]